MEKKYEQIEVKRHSLSHILAMAVSELWPEVKFAIGPAAENGFYYDFDFGEEKVNEEDLKKIEKKMNHLVKQNIKFEKEEVSANEAIAKEKNRKQKYKVELIEDLKGDGKTKVSYYKSGNFEDLCSGPHVESTKEINKGSFKLNKIAGAYWKGDEKNKMLTRIYGLAFETNEELKKHIEMMKEAAERDHRKLGSELDLFVTSKLVGSGLPLLTPKGSIIRQELERFIVDEETKRGYHRTYTPDLAKVDLYKKSGHWDHFKEDMYPSMEIEGDEYVLRPMTCPHQFMIYNSRPRSYKELPIRYAEIAKLYRREQSGELSGLIRVMSFSLVDAHIICRPDQLEKEFEDVVDLVQYGMKALGIEDYSYRFSKWDPNNKEKYIDDPESWHKSQGSMKKILDKMKLEYVEAEDEAAFYGPKLDVQMRNVNGKEDTAFTVQIDFAMPDRFDMSYIDKNDKKVRPMVIHRSSIGCLERTMAFLIERYAGKFPVWLSPVQVKIISVGEGHIEHCHKLAGELREGGVRVEVDDHSETVGNKIRKATQEKVPYVLVIGDKELKSEKLSVRDRGQNDTREISKKDFIDEIKEKIIKRN